MILGDVVLELPSFGRLSCQIAGPAEGPLVIALRGSGHKDAEPCWENTARLLSDTGFRVLLPDLHSNAATAPAAVSPAGAVKLVVEAADELQADRFHMMGKSWGGIVAFNTARAWPRRIRRLVLVSPPITDPGAIRGLPGGFQVLLLWAQRDAVMPFRLAQAFLDCLGDRVRLVTAPTDGSVAIAAEWLQPIQQFLAL